MTDLKLAQSFSMIALNGQRSNHITSVKKAALRAMAAAVILEIHLDGGFTAINDNKLKLNDDVLDPSKSTLYRDTIVKPLLSRLHGRDGDLRWWLKMASNLSKRRLIKFERAMSDSLKVEGLLEEIPHLLGCDLYFDSAGVEIKEYRSHIQEYSRITVRL